MQKDPTPSEVDLIAHRETLRSSLEIELINPAYPKYCYESGPLTIDQVDDELVDIDTLQVVLEKHEWPVETEGDFYKSRGYALPNFYNELFSNDIENKMTNFRARLKVPLINNMSEAKSPMEWYGMSPELHRAYAVAPVLMTNIQGIFASFEHLPMFQEAKATRDYFADEDNDAALEAVFVAYNMMTRLIRPEEGTPADIDSHDALTH